LKFLSKRQFLWDEENAKLDLEDAHTAVGSVESRKNNRENRCGNGK
jgi:hypothetical protein